MDRAQLQKMADELALVLINADREDHGLAPVSNIEYVINPKHYIILAKRAIDFISENYSNGH